ncbi:hypothetical protein E6O75_ATG04385 [Venturia nashicola]|uniref:Uncharacterized protein n=1 Tax=Venturia nashicola TaxID=86259 RepID=A0A4Z1PN82_9PEZI|nr:hypothetical protein E6O75_ATG04385 [Venturia nashicola]
MKFIIATVLLLVTGINAQARPIATPVPGKKYWTQCTVRTGSNEDIGVCQALNKYGRNTYELPQQPCIKAKNCDKEGNGCTFDLKTVDGIRYAACK